jgi:hypothetical protein
MQAKERSTVDSGRGIREGRFVKLTLLSFSIEECVLMGNVLSKGGMVAEWEEGRGDMRAWGWRIK